LASAGAHIYRQERCARCARSCGLQKFERSLAVDAEDGVFDSGVGGGVDAAAEKFVAGIDIFDLAKSGGTENVFENDGITGWVTAK